MVDSPTEPSKPLCVDLDGTLVKTDTFAQALLLLIRRRPLVLWTLLRRFSGGLAPLKRFVAQQVQLDPEALPYHTGLWTFLTSEHAKGRELILVTASDEQSARTVAAHCGLFSGCLASDGTTNLKAAAKRDALVERFGQKGFDYIGNSGDDRPVWDAAGRVIAANPNRSVQSYLRMKKARVFEDRPPRVQSWLRALRIQQWMKNALVFLPMLLAHRLTDPALYFRAAAAFFAFSFAASAVYFINDLFDLHADQHHPRKKNRPFAAGNLRLDFSLAVAPLLLLAAFGVAALLPAVFSGVLLLYLLMTTLYSWRLKQIALLDVLVLAGFYTLRILAGTAATGVTTSPWLLALSLFLFISLALAKRYAELQETAVEEAEIVRRRGRGYRKADLPLLAAFGAGGGITSVLVLALYINSDKVMQFYPRPAALWVLCPLLLYWIARIWLLAGRGELSDDPLDFAARDPQTWAVGAVAAMILVLGAL